LLAGSEATPKGDDDGFEDMKSVGLPNADMGLANEAFSFIFPIPGNPVVCGSSIL